MPSESYDDDETCLGEGPGQMSDPFQSGGIDSLSHLVSAKGEDKAEQHCPVCSRILVTDNQGLNEHIDFCLSRDAIREARSLAGVR